MANARIVQPPSPPPPPKLVVLELSVEEAAHLCVSLSLSRRLYAHKIYAALKAAGVDEAADFGLQLRISSRDAYGAPISAALNLRHG